MGPIVKWNRTWKVRLGSSWCLVSMPYLATHLEPIGKAELKAHGTMLAIQMAGSWYWVRKTTTSTTGCYNAFSREDVAKAEAMGRVCHDRIDR